MSKKITIILASCFLAFTVNAQKAELLKGKWEFKEIANKAKLDSTLLKQATFSFSSTEMEFIPGGKLSYNPFSANQLTKFNGTWSLNNEQTKVSAVLVNPKTNQQQAAEWDIVGLTKEELKLNMGNNTIVAFRRPVQNIATSTSNNGKATKELPIEIKSKTHTLYAYPGWQGIFRNPEKRSGLDSDYGDKTPSRYLMKPRTVG